MRALTRFLEVMPLYVWLPWVATIFAISAVMAMLITRRWRLLPWAGLAVLVAVVLLGEGWQRYGAAVVPVPRYTPPPLVENGGNVVVVRPGELPGEVLDAVVKAQMPPGEGGSWSYKECAKCKVYIRHPPLDVER